MSHENNYMIAEIVSILKDCDSDTIKTIRAILLKTKERNERKRINEIQGVDN